MAEDELTLFAGAYKRLPTGQPLAERMRPKQLLHVVGHDTIAGQTGLLTRLARQKTHASLLFWGPPGSGKTTLAHLFAQELGAHVATLSAVSSGLQDIRKLIEQAQTRRNLYNEASVVFIDEIHRFNRGQQDALLPSVETGIITLLGATTQNPSYEVNAALLSRLRLVVLRKLTTKSLQKLLVRALATPERGLGDFKLSIADEALQFIATRAAGDARRALGHLELAASLAKGEGASHISLDHLRGMGDGDVIAYDPNGDAHFHLVSAFIKVMRASDCDATLYYLARLLKAGEPARFILRRMMVFASEDIGVADAHALSVATHALTAFEAVGLPEGRLIIAHAAIYLARAPKDRRVMVGIDDALASVEHHGALEVPDHLCNAPTAMMKAKGFGQAPAVKAGKNLPVALHDTKFWRA